MMARLLAGWLAAVLFFAVPAWAAEPVDAELVLAVDISGSIDAYEFELQRKGYANAFRDPRVLDAIRANKLQRLAVTMVEWSAEDLQTQLFPFMLVKDAASAEALAQAILAPPRGRFRRTSISGGIDYSVKLFGSSNYVGERRIIDVSGDGINNSGRPAAAARDDAVKLGIIINGLAIMNDRGNPFGGGGGGGFGGGGGQLESNLPLDEYFAEKVIGGPGSFLIVTNDFEAFERAVVSKLVREIAGIVLDDKTDFAAAE